MLYLNPEPFPPQKVFSSWEDQTAKNWCTKNRRLAKHGTFTELRKIPISTEMSVVLLTKNGTADIS